MNEYLQALQSTEYDQFLGGYSLLKRVDFVKTYSWAIPNDEAIAYLVSVSPIIEIGAGSGYWAYLIQQAGGKILPFDINPYKNNWCEAKWTEVALGSADTVIEYPTHTLFLCWPPYKEPLAYDALVNYSGNRVIYIGEGWHGATASDEFHQLLNKEWEEELEIEIPQFSGIHDSLISYVRR